MIIVKLSTLTFRPALSMCKKSIVANISTFLLLCEEWYDVEVVPRAMWNFLCVAPSSVDKHCERTYSELWLRFQNSGWVTVEFLFFGIDEEILAKIHYHFGENPLPFWSEEIFQQLLIPIYEENLVKKCKVAPQNWWDSKHRSQN